MKQISFATLAEAGKKRKTRRERFLAEMERVVPWPALLALIEPHYPKAGKGRRPWPLETMLRLYFMQQCVVVKYFRTAPREVMRFVQPLRASYSCYSYAGAGSCNS